MKVEAAIFFKAFVTVYQVLTRPQVLRIFDFTERLIYSFLLAH